MTAALLLLLQAAAPAQVSGRVVRLQDGDSLAAAGARVVLHRVGPGAEGPLDSLRADADGRFSFRVRVALDTSDVLLVSARWHGIEHFGPPVVAGRQARVVVTDTSSTATVRVAARHIVIGGPAADGARDVVDLLVLSNASGFTRVGRDTTEPSWLMLLPPRVANLTVGDADFARETFDRHGDTLLLAAPIPPGDRQFFLQYQLAPGARSLDVPMDPEADTVSVLAEEPNLELGPGLALRGTEMVAGRSFTRWSGSGTTDIAVGLPGNRAMPGWLLPALIVALGLPLLWVTRLAFTRRR